LLQKLHACPQLVVCGQALSHCVNFTVRDIVDNWRGENSKIVVLENGIFCLLFEMILHFLI
jgi:nicotinamidase-related amidase